MVKPLKLTILVLCGVFLWSGSVLAIPLSTVGSIDSLVGWDTLANSGNEEQDWIQATFGENSVVVYDTVEGDWEQVDGLVNVYALHLQYEPLEFFIKVGTGQGSDGIELPTHMVYENNPELSYAVIDLNEWAENWGLPSEDGPIFSPSSFNIGRVSHVGEVAPVPEPSTIVLMGLGLVGLAGLGRKKFKK